MLLEFRGKFPKIGKDVFIAEGAFIIGDVEIGDFTNIWFNVVIRGDVNYIRVGKNVNIQDGTIIHGGKHGYPVFIGDNVSVGHRAVLHGCEIGKNCVIGIGSIILNGAKIGENCIIGAGSFVPQNTEIPPGTISFGIPAKTVKKIDEEKRAWIDEVCQEYLSLADAYRK